MRARIAQALARPVDAAGLAVFRIAFGLLCFVAAARMLLSGWIPRLYVEPRFFFKLWGLELAQPWSEAGMVAHYAALAALALCVAVGFHTRKSAALFFAGFTYTQLVDVTNYLNHHVLVSLLALLLVVVPTDGLWSVDAWRRPERRRETVPAWAVLALRIQVGLVYFHAGLAKLGADWLLQGQPLGIWLRARTETPLIGPWLGEPWVALAASWAAFLFDTTIVLWLSLRRTRPYAYAAVLVFHSLTHLLFNIGMFPFIMTVAATVFFSPSWPRRWLSAPARALAPAPPRPVPAGVWVLGALLAVQAIVPLRHLAYPGDVLWTEEGMRFAWKVMVREKHGSVTFHVRQPETGRSVQVSPRRYLTAKQEREMAGQPDLILQLARHIAADFRAAGHGDVEVRVEAHVSLNGRPPRLLVDPARDLAHERDGLWPKDWILPGPRDAGAPRVAANEDQRSVLP
jgi:vitamin K-dependent gamma-carboxylase